MMRHYTEEQLSAAAALIRAYDAVVVVGAGASADSFPMTADLPALLWQAIDRSPGALAELQDARGTSGSAKDLLRGEDLTLGWALIRRFADARGEFQQAFAHLDADRPPGAAHLGLARLVHQGAVTCVVSLNWDSCLERAYALTYGVPLPPGVLFKPHGSVAYPGVAWVLPDEPGTVGHDVLHRVGSMSDRPHVLTVIGYSESDEQVVRTLVGPLAGKWPVVRIGPSVSGDGAIPGLASHLLTELAALLAVEPDGWHQVTFGSGRDLGAALRGERLGPADVDACPELPSAPRVANRLATSRFATVVGSSGAGKSITAFHAARRMNKAGWEVIELRRPDAASSSDVDAFRQMRGPIVAVIDDAQTVDPALLPGFKAAIDDRHAVLIASTEQIEPRGDEQLLPALATQTIYEHCKRHIDVVGPLLSTLDDRVAKSAFSETPLRRLEIAYRSAPKDPWLFMFVASGGERRIGGDLDAICEAVTPAIVFSLLCIGQMTTRDAGITRQQIDAWAARFADIKAADVDVAIKELTARRLIRSHEGRLRAVHVRVADHALRSLGQRETARIGATTLACVRHCLIDQSISADGKVWLLQTLNTSDHYTYRLRKSFLDNEVERSLLEQCQSAPAGTERGTAIYLLWMLDFNRTMSTAAAEELTDSIIEWLPGLAAEEIYGLRWLLGGLRSGHAACHARVGAAAEASMVADRLCRVGSRANAGNWAGVLRELSPRFGEPDWLVWRDQFSATVNRDLLTAWLTDTDSDSRPYEVYEFIARLTEISPDVAEVAATACAPEIIHWFETDLVEASGNFSSWAFGITSMVARISDDGDIDDDLDDDERDNLPALGEDAGNSLESFGDHFDAELRKLSDTLLKTFQAVDWTKAAESIRGRELFELESVDLVLFWLSRLSPTLLDQFAAALSHDELLRLATDDSSETDLRIDLSRIGRLLTGLADGPRGSAIVRALLEENGNLIGRFPFYLIRKYPDLAVSHIRSGRSAEVRPPRGSGWHELRRVLAAIADVDPIVGRLYLAACAEAISESIEQPQAFDMNGFDRFAHVADALDRTIIDNTIRNLDISKAEPAWRQRADDARPQVILLLQRIAEVDCASGRVAATVLSSVEAAG